MELKKYAACKFNAMKNKFLHNKITLFMHKVSSIFKASHFVEATFTAQTFESVRSSLKSKHTLRRMLESS